MSKAGLISLLGFLSALLPFVGIPLGVKTVLAVVFGVLILALGFLVREERRWLLRARNGDHQTDAYTENGLMANDAPSDAQGYGQNIRKTQ